MIKKFLLVLMLVAMPLAAHAASFNAMVDSDRVNAGDTVVLQLNLSGAEAKGGPDTSVLTPNFDIAGQGQTSETQIVNGSISSSVGWQLTLLPKKTGQIVIPPIAINTDKGSLSTQPITLNIGGTSNQQSLQANPAQSRDSDVKIMASASTTDPYQNQPIIYTVRIVAHASLTDISVGDVVADNAIVQPQGDPTVKDTLDNGVPGKVIEFHYIVTPLEPKPITIQPVTLRGNIESPEPVGRAGQMGNGFADPFALLRAMNSNFPGFAQMKPFRITSNPVALNVKPPAVVMDPWLPLENLQIKENLDMSQPPKVGEPMTRTVTMVAVGNGGSQLPSLESQQHSADFKIYADKPKVEQSIDKSGSTLIGRREESYSLIPMQAGQLQVPPIRVAWWNVKTNRIAYAEVPGRIIDVMPGVAPTGPSADQSLQAKAPDQPAKPVHQISMARQNLRFWPSLAALMLGATAGIIFLTRQSSKKALRVDRNDKSQSEFTEEKPKSCFSINWENIRTPEELNDRLLAYAHDRWGTPRHAALETVFSQQSSFSAQQRQDIDFILRDLTAALYAGKKVDLDELKRICRELLATLDRPVKRTRMNSEKLPALNPD